MVSFHENSILYNKLLRETKSANPDLFEYEFDDCLYKNIPIERSILKSLYKIYQNGDSLIDLGSGIGNVLRFAENIGYKCKGVEIDQRFKEITKNFDIEFTDIRAFDKSKISNFDVVYSYLPFKNKSDFATYIDDIINHMKPKSHLLTPFFNPNNSLIEQKGLFLYQITTK